MDRGVFLLAATVVGAGIGYFVGTSFGEGLAGRDKAAKLGKGIGTLCGALFGVTLAGTYLYLELVARVFVWGGEAMMNHPIAALVTAVVVIGIAALVALAENSDKPPKGKKA